MNPYRQHNILFALKSIDIVSGVAAISLAMWIAYFGSRAGSFSDFLAVRVSLGNVAVFLVFLYLWHVILSSCGMYRPGRLFSPSRRVTYAITASSLAVLMLTIGARVFQLGLISPLFLAVFWGSSISALLLGRTILRYALRYRRVRGRNLRQVLIVGTNTRALRFARNICQKPQLGYSLIGFVDQTWAEPKPAWTSGYQLVADLDNLPAYLRDHVVDEVIICIPVKSFYDQAARIISRCEEQGVIVRFLPDFFIPKLGRSAVEELEDSAVISFYTGAMDGWQLTVKRIVDVSLAGVLLIALSPLFIATALLIKLDSPGPVFFAQDRVGHSKRRFRLYKFRTMVVDAEQRLTELETTVTMDGPAFKMDGDPRITPLGYVLRKTSIDELPQLFNVILGDMSLVGPRPTPVYEYAGFEHDWHRRRFSVRPGITGLWQISGRSSAPFAKRMELDMQYIDEWNLWLDLKILAKTVPVVIRGEGAV